MTLRTVRNIPVIPGFITSADADVLTATRIDPLSPYQLQYGCRTVVTAPTGEELDWLCVAERVKAELVARAEAATVLPLGACDDIPVSRTLMGLDEPGTADGG